MAQDESKPHLPIGDAVKLLVDVLKHLTTVAIGLLVAIGTVVEKYFTVAVWRWLIPTSIALLLICITTSIIAMLFLVLNSRQKSEDWASTTYAINAITSISAFLAAVVSIGIFMACNVW